MTSGVYIRTEKTRTYLSKINKGKKLSIETRIKMSEARMGRIVTEETRAKIAKSLRGRKRLIDIPIKRANTLAQNVEDGKVKEWYISYAQRLLYEALLLEFPYVQLEAPFGTRNVDIYLPRPYHLAIEVDGLDHNRKKMRIKDGLRESYLLENFNLPTARITNREAILIAEELMGKAGG